MRVKFYVYIFSGSFGLAVLIIRSFSLSIVANVN